MPMIFVDTWAWLALNDKTDTYHARVVKAHRAAVPQHIYVTTNFVLDETYTLLRRKVSAARAITFGRYVQGAAASGALKVVSLTPNIERDAWLLFERYRTVNDLSYTDCTSFAVMQQLGLRIAFTADQHFTMLGFELYPPAA